MAAESVIKADANEVQASQSISSAKTSPYLKANFDQLRCRNFTHLNISKMQIHSLCVMEEGKVSQRVIDEQKNNIKMPFKINYSGTSYM